MKNLLLSLLILLVPLRAVAEEVCHGTPVFCDIVKLKPSVDKAFAKLLARSITRYSKKFGTNPKYSVAIAMQESTFTNVDRPGTVLTKTNVFMKGATDLGVFQLHILTLGELIDQGHKVDVKKLRTDVDYQTYWHTKILKRKIRICTAQREKLGVEEGDEWSCYHSFTPKQRQTYVRFVTPYLFKIAPEMAPTETAADEAL